jgi:hypothetical protein
MPDRRTYRLDEFNGLNQIGDAGLRDRVRRDIVTPQTCAHGRARLFHVNYKPLYTAIGEPDNRFRRPMTLARAIERLMVLDAVLADPSLTWLATEPSRVWPTACSPRTWVSRTRALRRR